MEKNARKMILDSKKGIAFVWLAIIVIIALMGIIYVFLDYAEQKVKTLTMDDVTGTQYEKTFNQENVMWDYFLLFFFGSILIFGILEAIRKDNG
jgi:hypothetical protein